MERVAGLVGLRLRGLRLRGWSLGEERGCDGGQEQEEQGAEGCCGRDAQRWRAMRGGPAKSHGGSIAESGGRSEYNPKSP